MIIDIHTHIGDLSQRERRAPVTQENLLLRMDEEGIDRAVVLPLVSPESIWFPNLFTHQLDVIDQITATAARSDRLIPFGNVDPRMGGNTAVTDFSWILAQFVELGCVGLGEVTANLPADDPKVINLFRQCGEWDLPVIMHGTGPGTGLYGLIDDVGSPRLKRLLQEVPGTTVIGHGPGFWAEIGAGITNEERSGYPPGPIVEEGSLPRLLRAYPNLVADTSAMSGYNALSRDDAYGPRFLQEFQDKILLGTDVCFGDPRGRMPHLSFLRKLLREEKISQVSFDKITGGNALRVLKRYHRDGSARGIKWR